MKRFLTTGILLSLVSALGVLAATALAAPGNDQYTTTTVTTSFVTTDPNVTPPTQAGTGSLPFTGAPLLIVVIIGVGLIVLGLFLRYRVRRTGG